MSYEGAEKLEVVRVENLSKKYRLPTSEALRPQPTSFRELLTIRAAEILRRRTRSQFDVSPAEEFWALKDINFSVAEGMKLGIIGRNGAGKSTLLKILSRITIPTEGRVTLRGRTASLLEVGTGFHPELTGRENIFMNGALLGMSKADIRRKLPEIVDFAGVEQFLDIPVKHYSSGMYVRLAFSVAAHVEPDILILDEVLAVGDLEFQRKCFGKMDELGASARAVLFVTHDLAAVSSLCNRCLLLDAGRVVFDGAPAEAVLRYYELNPVRPGVLDYANKQHRAGDAHARLLQASVAGPDGKPRIELDIHEPFTVSMRYWLSGEVEGAAVPNIHFLRADGTPAFVAMAPEATRMPAGEYIATVNIPGDFLNDGAYSIGFALTTFARLGYKVHFYEQNALTINVRDPRDVGSLRYGYAGEFPGVVRPKFNWTIQKVSSTADAR